MKMRVPKQDKMDVEQLKDLQESLVKLRSIADLAHETAGEFIQFAGSGATDRIKLPSEDGLKENLASLEVISDLVRKNGKKVLKNIKKSY